MKKLSLLIAVGSTLTLAACNNGGSSSAKPSSPAARPIAGPIGGFNNANGAGGPPPPPTTSTAPTPSGSQARRNFDDDQIIAHDTVIPSRPADTIDTSRRETTAPDISRTETRPSTTPVVTTRPVTPAPSTERPAAQCGAPYQAPVEWTPGLPAAPSATPIFTDLAGSAGSLRFTDARQDSLFAVAVDKANALPAAMQKGNQEFAKQIRDVKISVDMIHTKEVKVRVTYLHQMQKSNIDLRGVMESPTQVALVEVPVAGAKPSTLNFAGVLTCADADRGCKNILLRLDLKSAKNKIVRSLFVVHRWGEAHITLSEQDRRQFAKIPNQNQSAFTEYLSNSVNNSCLNILAEVKAGRRELPVCATERLQQACGSEDVKKPAAKSLGLRTWAVAYGRSGFEFALSTNNEFNGVSDFDLKRTPFMTVRGPLAYAAKGQAYSHPLAVTGAAKGVQNVFLMNNDGGGNLNFRFDFLGSSDANSRVSVSSMLPNTAYSQSVVQNAQQMPNVPQQDVEQQDSVVEQASVEASDVN